MPLTPEQYKAREERRAAMTSEERQVAALETIADNMLDLRLELTNVVRALNARASSTSGFGR